VSAHGGVIGHHRAVGGDGGGFSGEFSGGPSGVGAIDGDGDGRPHHSGVTEGDADYTTGGVNGSERGGGLDSHGAVGGDGDGFSGEFSGGPSGAGEIDGDGAGRPHHLGVTEGAAGFTTGGVTSGLERSGGLSYHGVVVGIDGSSASSSGCGANRPPLPCYSNKDIKRLFFEFDDLSEEAVNGDC